MCLVFYYLEQLMKVPQLVLGDRYESKDGDEVREIISFVSDGTLRYVTIPIVADVREARRIRNMRRSVHESSRKDFAKWARQPIAQSTAPSSSTSSKALQADHW